MIPAHIQAHDEARRLAEQLREGVMPQSCEACDKDSVVFIRCGRGTCKAERQLMEKAADALLTLLRKQEGMVMVAQVMRAMANDGKCGPVVWIKSALDFPDGTNLYAAAPQAKEGERG